MKNRYRSGRIHEGKVARRLGELGWTNVRQSKGSRGAADVYARTPSGVKAYIQVKSGSASVTRNGLKSLRALAKDRRGIAVTASRREGRTKIRFWGRWPWPKGAGGGR